ncbi:alpha-amylase family glycosyl hydrolase [Plantactinospora sp. GCM10030261]|uniref:alpha-amylase family glycosyl hydrolase n=1 Tax=Plantactinospora sp. GCM10030261 TaxID=3273420 RepID=UPI00360ABCF7
MTPWWQGGVVYQVYPQSFQDTDADGHGDLAGIVRRLDYLVDVLGVDAIWINPFYRSPMVDNGYDVTDHREVDPRYGSLADFDELLDRAHRRGLRVLVDFIPAHTSDEHPWFREASAARDAERRDWYIWRDPGPDGGPPNNWLAHWGGSAWTWHSATGQYFLHTYLSRMPDLNWENPDVRKAMFDVARFWLDRGVDGFRVDSAHIIGKDPLFRDNPPNIDGVLEFGRPHGDMDSQLHVYDRGTGRVHEIYREFRSLLDGYGAVSVGEVAVTDPRTWAGYYGADLDELHMPFNFRLLGVPWTAEALRAVIDTVEATVPPGGWPNWVLGNHDEPRVASRLGPARARLAMMLLLTLRGTPVIYYGDELGLPDVPVPPERVRDPWERRMPGRGLGRDPERSPMPWDAGRHAGFCLPDVEPWLPIDETVPPVSAQSAEPRSMLAFTRDLLRIRRAHPELALGTYRPVGGMPAGCLAYLREHAGGRCLVVLNLDDRSARLDVTRYGPAELLAGTHPRVWRADAPDVVLVGHEGVVLRLAPA